MGAEEQIVLDRIEQNIRELNRTMREFMRLYEERTRGRESRCDGVETPLQHGCNRKARKARKGSGSWTN